jgi:hypothetical protein
MLDKIGKWLSDLVKWTLLIIIAAVALYFVSALILEQFCPKYYFSDITITKTQSGEFRIGGVRCNKITGEIAFVVSNNIVNDLSPAPTTKRVKSFEEIETYVPETSPESTEHNP